MPDDTPRRTTEKEVALLDWIKRHGCREVGRHLQKVEEAMLYGHKEMAEDLREACLMLRRVAHLVTDIE